MSTARLLAQDLLDQKRQAVELLPHVARLDRDMDLYRRWQRQHGAVSRATTTARSSPGSKPRPTRTTLLLPTTTSTVGSAGAPRGTPPSRCAEGASFLTTCTGRNAAGFAGCSL